MDLFDRLKAAWRPRSAAALAAESWAEALVLAYEREAAEVYTRGNLSPKFDDLEAGRQVLARERADWIEVLAAALSRLQRIDEERKAAIGPNTYTMAFLGRSQPLGALVTRLLRTQLPFSAERFAAIAQYCVENVGALRGAPLRLLLRQAEHIAGGQAVTGPLAVAVEQLSRAAASPPRGSWKAASPEAAEVARRLLAGESKAAPILKASPWREQVMAVVKALPTDAAAPAWRAIDQALEAEGKAKPTKVFLSAARQLLTEHPSLAAQILGWIEGYTPEPPNPEPNEHAIRGLIWLLAASDAEKTARRLGDYGELCFKKLPNIGARSVKLGNGVIQTLALLGGPHAIGELTRLKKRVRYPAVAERIEAALTDLAARSGMGRDEMEELSLPTYELSRSGERRLSVADGAAILRLHGKEVRLTWQRADGREAASLPKSIQDADAEGVKRARALRKDIEATLAGQAARLEALYLTDRRIPFAAWHERYRDHPLLADLTARLLWVFDSAGKSFTGLPRGDAVEDVAGRSLAPPDDAVVHLWHPLHASADEIGAWRERLAALQITQPFKQAHRETYVLTDAERQTNLYSNRFAAHILRQHQFKALCDQRGWRYRLMGPWDSHNTPTRAVPGHPLSVEFWVDHVESGEAQSGAVYALIATDQVRFVQEGRTAVGLAEVPPLVFSELMRDVDLFVGVASVGTDPDWVDGGPDRRFGAYWREFAFGAIGESGKARKLALEALLPRLAIGGQCMIDDRFLVVRGKLGTYKIHLGSGNILMQPDDRYLCIVPARGKDARFVPEDRLVLPFEGDSVLSVVLSKAFLLAADDAITDPSILHQIKRA